MEVAGTEVRESDELPAEVRDWAESFRSLSDTDEEPQAQGKFYTCSFLRDLGERYPFATRASADTWCKFATPPPPMSPLDEQVHLSPVTGHDVHP